MIIMGALPHYKSVGDTLPVPRELAAVKLRIEAVCGKQRGMVALLNDLSAAHHENDIGFADGRETVRYDE